MSTFHFKKPHFFKYHQYTPANTYICCPSIIARLYVL